MKHWTPMQRIVWLITVGWLLFICVSFFAASYYVSQSPLAYQYWFDDIWWHNFVGFRYSGFPQTIYISIPLATVLFIILITKQVSKREYVARLIYLVMLVLPYAGIALTALLAEADAITLTGLIDFLLLVALSEHFVRGNTVTISQ